MLIGGFETTTVEMLHDGSVRVTSGISPHGQGLETTIAQIVADRLGVDLDRVELVTGDTASTPYSAYGTAASRSLPLGGGAAVLAADQVAEQLRAIAAEMLEAAPEDVVLASGRAHVAGTVVGVPVTDRRPPGVAGVPPAGRHVTRAACDGGLRPAEWNVQLRRARLSRRRGPGHGSGRRGAIRRRP